MESWTKAFHRSIKDGEGVRDALSRLVSIWDGGVSRVRHPIKDGEQVAGYWNEVTRDGHVSRKDFCAALETHFRGRTELVFSAEGVFDACYTGARGERWLPATVAGVRDDGRVSIVFTWGEREDNPPPQHVRAANSGDGFIVGQKVEAQLRRVSLNDVAAALAPIAGSGSSSSSSSSSSGGDSGSGGGVSGAAGADDAARCERLARIVRRRDRPARLAGTWFEGQGAFAAALTANNASGEGDGEGHLYKPSDPVQARACPAILRAGGVSLQRLTPTEGALSDGDNRIAFPQFLGALKRYIGEDEVSDHGPLSESVECRVAFLPRDARLLFDSCERDERGRVRIGELAALVEGGGEREMGPRQSGRRPAGGAGGAASCSAAPTAGRTAPHKRSSVAADAPFHTNVGSSNSRTWGSRLGGGHGDGWLAASAKISLGHRCSGAVPGGGATAAARQQPILTLLRCLKRALRPEQMHRGALAATLSAFEEPYPSTMTRKVGLLQTEVNVVGRHKTGWMVEGELQAGLSAMLPNQDKEMVDAGATALFEQLSQQLPVDDHRRTQDQQRSAMQPEAGPTRKPTQVLDLIHVNALCSWMAKQLAKKDLHRAAEGNEAGQGRRSSSAGASSQSDARLPSRSACDPEPGDEERLAALVGRLRRRAPPGSGMPGLHEALGKALASFDQVSKVKASAPDGELDFDTFYRALRTHVGLNTGMAYTHVFHREGDVAEEDARRLFAHYATSAADSECIDPARVLKGLADPRKLSVDHTPGTVSKPAWRVANAIRLLRRRTPQGCSNEEMIRRTYCGFATRADPHADTRGAWLTREQFCDATRVHLGQAAKVESADLDLLFYHILQSSHNAPATDAMGTSQGAPSKPEDGDAGSEPKVQRNFYQDSVGGELKWPPSPPPRDTTGAPAAKISLFSIIRCIETNPVDEFSRRRKLGLATQGWQTNEDMLATATALATAKPAEAFQI